MDQALLVESGQALVEKLDQTDVKPRAALWVYDPDMERWRLWIVPDKRFSAWEERNFYLRVAETVTSNQEGMHGLSAGDVEMMLDDHPAIRGLAPIFPIEGLNSVQASSILVDGFYLKEGIILRMAL